MPYKIGPEAVHPGKISIVTRNPELNMEYETIERKGMGHPDTISDTLAARVSQAYSKYTTQHCEGMVLHHQIDKLMVIGGRTEVEFGGGRFVQPIRIIVAGRASYDFLGKKIPVEEIVNATIRAYFKDKFPVVRNEDLIIENHLTNFSGPGTIKQSTGSIANMFNPVEKGAVRGYEELVANDTSYCVAYEPLSALESAILQVEKFLNNPETKKLYPWLGSDIKIMAVRDGKQVSITSCIPQISSHVHSFDEYMENLKTVGQIMDNMFGEALPGQQVDISLNTKDNYQKMNVYLTVSGASLSGDIGVVGRGNRTNGLITSNRPMSMEGTNGKNPRYYSGFIYANLTKKIAARIHKETSQPNIVEMVSQNGGPLKDPWHTRVVTEADALLVMAIIQSELGKVEEITEDFLNGNIENY
jgi:S-adenosylmethionine synthetase